MSHLHHRAIFYVRQSTWEQARESIGNTERRRELVKMLHEWGWPEEQIAVIDTDLGRCGSKNTAIKPEKPVRARSRFAGLEIWPAMTSEEVENV